MRQKRACALVHTDTETCPVRRSSGCWRAWGQQAPSRRTPGPWAHVAHTDLGISWGPGVLGTPIPSSEDRPLGTPLVTGAVGEKDSRARKCSESIAALRASRSGGVGRAACAESLKLGKPVLPDAQISYKAPKSTRHSAGQGREPQGGRSTPLSPGARPTATGTVRIREEGRGGQHSCGTPPRGQEGAASHPTGGKA